MVYLESFLGVPTVNLVLFPWGGVTQYYVIGR